MRLSGKRFLAILLSEILIFLPVGCAHRTTPPATPLVPEVFKPLQEALNKSYLELFPLAPTLEFSQTQIDRMRQYLQQANDYCVGQFKKRAQEYSGETNQAQAELKKSAQTPRTPSAMTSTARSRTRAQRRAARTCWPITPSRSRTRTRKRNSN